MRKFATFLVLLFMGMTAVQAAEHEDYAQDPTGKFDLKLVYDDETETYEVFMTYFNSSSLTAEQLKSIEFPATVHAVFNDYDGKGNKLEDDFAYKFDTYFSIDFVTTEVRDNVESITVLGGGEIPSGFAKYQDNEFSHNEPTALKTVVIGDGITSVGSEAFAYHENLQEVTIGNQVTSIGNYAFKAARDDGSMGMEFTYYGSIETIELPAGLMSLGEEAFYGQGALKSVYLPGALSEIGMNAFGNCGIEDVTVAANAGGSGLMSSPFVGCPLKNVTIEAAAAGDNYMVSVVPYLFANVTSTFDVTFTPDPTDAANVYEGVLFYEGCFSQSGVRNITMPVHYVLSPMLPYAVLCDVSSFAYTTQLRSLDMSAADVNNIEIGTGAFAHSYIESISLSSSLKSIANEAFYDSRLKSLVIPAGKNPYDNSDRRVEIGESVFAYTTELKTVEINADIVSNGEDDYLPSSTFTNSAVEECKLPASLAKIGSSAFAYSNLKSFTGGKSLVEIGDDAFNGCQHLEKVDLSDTKVTILNSYLLEGCAKLSELKLRDNMESIKAHALEGTGLTSLRVDAQQIEALAITNMPNLESVSFVNEKYNTVLENTLTMLPSLKSIDWGMYVTTLGENAIVDCPALDSLVTPAAAENIDKDAFDGISSQVKALYFNSPKMKAPEDDDSSPFRVMEARLYFDKSVKNVEAYVFADMHVSNSPELRSDLAFDEDAFAEAIIDSLNWHYPSESFYPFKKAYVDRMAFGKMKTIANNLFADGNFGTVYLDGIEEIGESAFEDALMDNGYLDNALVIPASVKTIGNYAFSGVVCDKLIFEKGSGLTIGDKAFQLDAGKGAFKTIRSYYDKDNVPAAATAFDIADDIDAFYAGSCQDVEAYKAADGWKELPVKKWDGLSEYKYTYEVIGDNGAHPIEFYLENALLVNGMVASQAVVTCDNKMDLKFFSPCADITFDHWADNSTDEANYSLTLTSDTVIRIYVTENEYDLTLALENAALSGIAKIQIAQESTDWDWVEKSETKVSTCNKADIDLELLDTDHYYFIGWYDSKDKLISSSTTLYGISAGDNLIAKIGINQYYVSVSYNPGCMYCYGSEATNHFELNGKDMGKNDFGENIDYGTEVTIKFVGEKGTDYRYVIDYWEDEYGNTLSEENEYTFTVTDYVTIHPVIKLANTYAITASSADEKLGTVTMTAEADAETEKGSGLYWEGSKIELSAAATAEHTYFKQWKDGEKSSVRTITVNKAYEYVAEFERDSFDITVKVEGIDAELVTVSGTGRYGWNDEVTLSYTLSDEEHYTFDAWYGDKIYGDEATFTFAAQKNAEVRLRFVANTYTITAVAEPAEGGTITGSGDAPYKATVILTATANKGYTFVGWKDDDTALAKREVEVTGNATYTAVFAAIDYTPQNLYVARETIGDDERITLSWDAVAGADSYEIMLLNGSQVITTANTMGYTVVSQLVSVLKEDYNLAGGTYTINWAVRSTDENGIDISDWAYGESFVITIADAPTALDETESDVRARKVVKDGVIYIIKGDKVYNALGKEIR